MKEYITKRHSVDSFKTLWFGRGICSQWNAVDVIESTAISHRNTWRKSLRWLPQRSPVSPGQKGRTLFHQNLNLGAWEMPQLPCLYTSRKMWIWSCGTHTNMLFTRTPSCDPLWRKQRRTDRWSSLATQSSLLANSMLGKRVYHKEWSEGQLRAHRADLRPP